MEKMFRVVDVLRLALLVLRTEATHRRLLSAAMRYRDGLAQESLAHVWGARQQLSNQHFGSIDRALLRSEPGLKRTFQFMQTATEKICWQVPSSRLYL